MKFLLASLVLVAVGSAFCLHTPSTPDPTSRVESAQDTVNAAPALVEQLNAPADGPSRSAALPPANLLRIRGRVVDTAGQLVRGGEIVAKPFDARAPSGERHSTVSVPSDGAFEIELARPSEIMFEGVEGWRTLVSALVHDAESTQIEHEIIAIPARLLYGTVAHKNGATLRGMYVRERLPREFLERLASVPPEHRRWCLERWVKTYADGSFVLPIVSVPGATVEVVEEGHVVASVLVPDDITTEVRIVCVPQGISGIVVDERGEPEEGVTVEWNYTNRPSSVTDELGAFELAAGGIQLLPHSVLHVRDESGTGECWNFDERWHARDTTRPLRLVLPSSSSSIRGVVVDASGAPVAEWYVTANAVERGGTDVVLTREDEPAARTGPDGAFQLRYLAPGLHDLIALSPGGATAFTAESVAAGRSDLTMRVPADLVIPLLRGRVETGDGEPLAGTQVVFHQPLYGRGCVSYVEVAHTDAAGRFEVAGLSRRLTTVEILRVPPGSSRLRPTPLVVNALDETVLRLPAHERVLFERRRLDVEGRRLSFRDAQGNALTCEFLPTPDLDRDRYSTDWPYPWISLESDAPPELLVDPSAAFAIVSSARAEIARIPLRLQHGVANRVIWSR